MKLSAPAYVYLASLAWNSLSVLINSSKFFACHVLWLLLQLWFWLKHLLFSNSLIFNSRLGSPRYAGHYILYILENEGRFDFYLDVPSYDNYTYHLDVFLVSQQEKQAYLA